jgi:hypothetical protein
MAPCPGCGLPKGPDACQSLFHELAAVASTDLRFGRYHRQAVDTYCLQHPPYIASAKSLMAHLGGLCITFEYRNDPAAHSVLLKSLNGKPSLARPAIPKSPGTITIASVMRPPNAETHAAAVDNWSRAVWEAYTPLHQFAREWIERAWRR